MEPHGTFNEFHTLAIGTKRCREQQFILSRNTKTPRSQVPGRVLDARADGRQVVRHVGSPEGVAVGSFPLPGVILLRPRGWLLVILVLGRRLDVTSREEAVCVHQVHRHDHQRPHGHHGPLDDLMNIVLCTFNVIL